MSEQHVSKNQSTDLDTSSKDEIDLKWKSCVKL